MLPSIKWFLLAAAVSASSPYTPASGSTYYLEVLREQSWPACQYRFMSFSSACDGVDLWKGAGGSQEFTLEKPAGTGGIFYIKLGCGKYLSYSGDCNVPVVDTWPEAGANQEFRIQSSSQSPFSVTLEAVGRSSCAKRYVGTVSACNTTGPDHILLYAEPGADQTFHMHPVRAEKPHVQAPASENSCADPYAWRGPGDGDGAHLMCTTNTEAGRLSLYSASNLSTTTVFKQIGECLGGSLPEWAQDHERWAPENLSGDDVNALVFCDAQPEDGKHRVGWVLAPGGEAKANAWTNYSVGTLDLGAGKGGEIDPHIFRDTDGRTYLAWKTDDNSVNDPVTRLWAQEVVVSLTSVELKGERKLLLDSTQLWWVTSFVPSGALVEGPEIVKWQEYYYLFFAAGRYCQDSYSEGVARSKNLWGPYEKMPVPLLSTGIVGTAPDGSKLVGPGHASFIHDERGQWYSVWHASMGENCDRYAFINALNFGDDGWPYVDFS